MHGQSCTFTCGRKQLTDEEEVNAKKLMPKPALT